jgi:tetratricopeptide (TPR) repeat protein
LGLDASAAGRFFAMATAAYERGDFKAAHDAAFLATSCDTTKASTWLLLGATCAQLGSYPQAKACFNAALEREADNLGAMLGLGEAHIATQELAAAASYLHKAVTLDPAGDKEPSRRARMLLVARGQWKLGLQALSALAQFGKK